MPFLRVFDTSIEYKSVGPPPDEAPTIVFLHEGLGSVDLWRDFPDRVSEATGWGAFLYSRWGYGRSDARGLPRRLDYLEDEGERWLPAVLAEAGISEHILWGHSDGGSIALITAGSHPHPGLRGVMSVAGHVFAGEDSSEMVAIGESYETGTLRDRLAKYHDHVDDVFRGWYDTWTSPTFQTWSMEQYLPHVAVPTVVCQGADDEHATLAQVDRTVSGIGELARPLVIPDCGHQPHLEHPERMIEETAAFLDSLSSS